MKQSKILAMAAGLAMILGTAPALAAGDAAAGEKVFNKCKACHSLEAGQNRVGPSLAGVIGRKAGTAEGFKYSKSMAEAGEKGLVWDAKALHDYLEDPTKFLREYLDDKKARGKMTFKLKKDDDREDVSAFLQGK